MRVEGERAFSLSAHIVDAFKTGEPVELVGWAERRACTKGAVWVFVMAPEKSGIKSELEALAGSAVCDQPLPPKK